ncbi:cytochrome c oxidase assembly protein [Streptomyces tauricus]|uniref:cytochrome c oxidase assembly protein n=1 Tax=Streptomyces tauricus TaxID=68274 RepID=UPI0034234505
MTQAHGQPVLVLVELLILSAAVAAYLMAASRLRRRGDAWPRWRDGACTAGSVATAWATVGELPWEPFTAHMVRHLVLGMLAPLLLVLAHPLTLVLRSLAPGRARRGLLSLARSRPVGLLVFPPLAGLLNMGGMWLIYRTPLLAVTEHHPLPHSLVHAHVLAAGLLFTFAVCSLDPVRRRWGLDVRGGTLLAVGAAHSVLARTLYATPPPGTRFAAVDLHQGAQMMYYGGDLAEGALAVVLGIGWYTATGRAWARRLRREPRTLVG